MVHITRLVVFGPITKDFRNFLLIHKLLKALAIADDQAM